MTSSSSDRARPAPSWRIGLAEDGKNNVLVLEYGGTDWGPLIQMPSALSYPMNMKRYDWGFVSEPEPHLNNRRLVTPRGKVIGGSSSINGMVYVRGHAKDYDTWEEMGARGWGYRHVLPYFKRMETSHGGEEGWRGTNGPLHVTRGTMKNPLYQAFIDAGREAGYPVTEDYNGSQQEGLGPFEMTVWKGVRWSSANAYLRPALKTGKIKLETHALARRIILDGKRATGVEYEQGGQIKSAYANREVILAASALNSPKLSDAVRYRSCRSSEGNGRQRPSMICRASGRISMTIWKYFFRCPARNRSRSTARWI